MSEKRGVYYLLSTCCVNKYTLITVGHMAENSYMCSFCESEDFSQRPSLTEDLVKAQQL